MNELLQWTIDAHGGLERWERVREVRVSGRMGGMALLTSKYDDDPVRLGRIDPRRQRVTVEGFPSPTDGTVLVYDNDTVSIEAPDGSRHLKRRLNPRRYFTTFPWYLRRRLWYDLLDVGYFMTYSIWNYFLTPFIFSYPEFEVEEGEPLESRRQTYRRLIVRYPPNLATHSREQVYFIDPQGLISHFYYTVDIVGTWVQCVHFCRQYRDWGGIRCATRRRVFLRRDRTARKLRQHHNIATLMWGDLEKVEYV